MPFMMKINSDDAHSISTVDMKVCMVQGNETCYQYNITGGEVGGGWLTLLSDEENNIGVGFVNSTMSDNGRFRYTRIAVEKMVNTHNGNEVDRFAGCMRTASSDPKSQVILPRVPAAYVDGRLCLSVDVKIQSAWNITRSRAFGKGDRYSFVGYHYMNH
ncbi:carbohydrate-binding module family 32 protein [Polychaeton citri CBS 116435]|uniref:Carbohydrate-binding module family 32 protein n=1 Tax=Polychaeton citri CBS 116435 TaxID=1314669 RepID=A0A9P4QI43_9PEZI|nr:carbohydrate-binding module family 32 protein [Polychaeton citri CBS 116435]